jgi:hypothetical protein
MLERPVNDLRMLARKGVRSDAKARSESLRPSAPDLALLSSTLQRGALSHSPSYRGPMDHIGYYAEAFYPEPGQCFRMVSSSTQGAPVLCPSPVEFRGRFQDGRGKWHEVWSCIHHAGDLTSLGYHLRLANVASIAVDAASPAA